MNVYYKREGYWGGPFVDSMRELWRRKSGSSHTAAENLSSTEPPIREKNQTPTKQEAAESELQIAQKEKVLAKAFLYQFESALKQLAKIKSAVEKNNQPTNTAFGNKSGHMLSLKKEEIRSLCQDLKDTIGHAPDPKKINDLLSQLDKKKFSANSSHNEIVIIKDKLTKEIQALLDLAPEVLAKKTEFEANGLKKALGRVSFAEQEYIDTHSESETDKDMQIAA